MKRTIPSTQDSAPVRPSADGLCPFLMTLLLLSGNTAAQTVDVWITARDQTILLEQQAPTAFSADSNSATVQIDIDETTTYQSIDGFGYTVTEGSAEVISTLDEDTQDQLLNEIYGADGLASQVVRISIGASDLSSSSYSYNDVVGDTDMVHFSLDGPDRTFLLPVLQKIIGINPSVKILATPWSAPIWMKTNNSYIGGSLLPEYYAAYAKYFVKYISAMRAEGIEIWAVTPQNEPENPNNEPSMTMNAYEQYVFIDKYLGPALRQAYYNTRIICFDHNCDNPEYPIEVCNASSYAFGSAFHLYGGSITAMTTVHNATGKPVYFTEQYTGSDGSFSGDFAWHMNSVVLNGLNNRARVVLEWNLANNTEIGPHTPGGCTTCLGAITVTGVGSYERNVSYYVIGQASRFIKNGAVRIASTCSARYMPLSAFKNPDGSVVLLLINNAKATSIRVSRGASSFAYPIPGNTAATLMWDSDPVVPVSGMSAGPVSPSLPANSTLQMTANLSPWDATNKNVSWRTSNASVALVNGNGLVTGLNPGTAVITVIAEDGDMSAASDITVTSLVQAPYADSACTLPGTVEIEKYDRGGEGMAYHDADAANTGTKFRVSEGVDIEKCSSGGFDISWISAGEWLEYSVDVACTDVYTLDASVSSDTSTGAFHVEFDGIDKTGILDVPDTGSRQAWQIVSKTGITLNAGRQIMRIVMDGPGFSFDKVNFSSASVALVSMKGTGFPPAE
ncbi:carbohydrate-binding protein [bacterium]|nr:carbohydrate-binding protein [bacterium]